MSARRYVGVSQSFEKVWLLGLTCVRGCVTAAEG